MYLAPIFFYVTKSRKKTWATLNVNNVHCVHFTSNNFNCTESKCRKGCRKMSDGMTTQFQFIIIIRKWWGSICIKVKTEKKKNKKTIMFYLVMLFLFFSHSFYCIKVSFYYRNVYNASEFIIDDGFKFGWQKKRSGIIVIEYSWLMVD